MQWGRTGLLCRGVCRVAIGRLHREYGLDKFGEEGVDKGGGCCIVQHGFKGKGCFGDLAEHDVIKVCFGIREA